MKALIISFSPHEKGTLTTDNIMWNVVLALMPAFLSSIYFYGIRAIVVTGVAMLACMLIQYLIERFLLCSEIEALDGSAAITGMLLAFNLPSGIPLWQVVIGSIVAIGIAKMPFGGIGKNPFNPALIGRAFMLVSFPVDMTTWPLPEKTPWLWNADVITGATPLGVLKENIQSLPYSQLSNQLPSHFDMFLGTVGGCIGETSALALLLGGGYLLYKKIISWHIPVFYLGTLFVFTAMFSLINPDQYADPLFHVLAGGAVLGAVYMATDMVTSPMTRKGQIIFAVGGGLLCGLIRLFGAFPEGCSYSILIMNAFVPLIDKYTKPQRFGKEVNFG
jgi:electron transport complex protein RnfD